MTIFSTFSPSVRSNLAVLFVAGLCFGRGWRVVAHLPLFIETLGGSGQQIGIVMASFAIGLIVARPTLSRLADERGRKLVMLIGLSAIALAPFGYLLVAILPHLVFPGDLFWDARSPSMLNSGDDGSFAPFMDLSIAAFVVAYSALVIDIAPPANRGELIGYMSLVNPLVWLWGQPWAGFLYEAHVAFSRISGDGGFGAESVWYLILRLEEPYRPVPPDAQWSPGNRNV
jgi:MFS family permease